jgi:hypothetical protein
MAGYVTPTSPRLHLPGQSVLVVTFHPGLVFFTRQDQRSDGRDRSLWDREPHRCRILCNRLRRSSVSRHTSYFQAFT